MRHMHTVIEDPLQLRKQILESALCSTEAAKSMETLRTISEDMIVFRKQLKAMVKTLKMSMSKVQQSLPELPQEFREQSKPAEQPEHEEPAVVKEQSLFLSGREQFQDDLEGLRERIRSLER